MLELHSDATDEEIHAAVVDLIQKRALVPLSPHIPYDWEVANPQEHPDTDPSLRTTSTSAESEARLQQAVSSQVWVDETLSMALDKDIATRIHESPADVTYLESHILVAIDHIGWYAYLWFPFVQREHLNFGSHAPASEIHQVFPRLIRKRALVPVHDEPGDRPDWLPAPEASRTAVYKALGLKI